MAISEKSIKILWSAAAGRCAFPNCKERLTFSETGEFAPYIIGEMAHIYGDQPASNRHDKGQTSRERDDYENLILLCPTHHRLIDRRENEARFPADFLKRIKIDHETRVLLRLESVTWQDRRSVAIEIAPLLAENNLVWLTYGPLSDFARKTPHNDSAHSVWRAERICTIVPNNRRITEILQSGIRTFDPSDHSAIAAFRMHVRSYEQWVVDEIAYDGVVKFPGVFAIDQGGGAWRRIVGSFLGEATTDTSTFSFSG